MARISIKNHDAHTSDTDQGLQSDRPGTGC